jgi:hypothetical protein
MASQSLNVVYGERASKSVDAEVRGDALWIAAADFERVSGWALKPEGFCRGETCVPVPAARKDDFIAGNRYNLAALARMLGQPIVRADAQNVWCVGEAAAERKRALTSLQAPDFTLPDLSGTMHSLSQHRGKKVMLASWASW